MCIGTQREAFRFLNIDLIFRLINFFFFRFYVKVLCNNKCQGNAQCSSGYLVSVKWFSIYKVARSVWVGVALKTVLINASGITVVPARNREIFRVI